jgi:C6 transcription factor Pro1
MHLGAATTLVPALVQVRMVSITPGSISSGHENGRQDERILHSEDDSAIKFLLGSFISIDIIPCASTSLSPFLQLDHKLMLERADIYLENLTGCSNWAIIFIFEITLLDKWKKESEEAHKLSIVELAKRGGQIEERLQERLADIEKKSSIRASSGDTFGTLPATTYTEITKIFALSAMTYGIAETTKEPARVLDLYLTI